MTSKTFTVIATIFYLGLFCFTPATWGESLDKEVYVLNVDGKVYLKSPEEKKTEEKNLQIYEIIPQGAILMIKPGASVTLTCPNCKIVKKKSTYKIHMKDFEQEDRSITRTVLDSFWKAVKSAACPACEPGQVGKTAVRGTNSDKTEKNNEGLWPSDRSDIMAMSGFIVFEWELKGSHFYFEIREKGDANIIYSETTTLNTLHVPLEKLNKGTESVVYYDWSIKENTQGKTREATFALLSKKETEELLNHLHEISALLPAEADDEVMCRLQAGYLRNELLFYNARQWMESKKVYRR